MQVRAIDLLYNISVHSDVLLSEEGTVRSAAARRKVGGLVRYGSRNSFCDEHAEHTACPEFVAVVPENNFCVGRWRESGCHACARIYK